MAFEKTVHLNNKFVTCEERDNAHMLKVGRKYEIDHLDIYAFHTHVILKSLPRHEFNSVLFRDSDMETILS